MAICRANGFADTQITSDYTRPSQGASEKPLCCPSSEATTRHQVGDHFGVGLVMQRGYIERSCHYGSGQCNDVFRFARGELQGAWDPTIDSSKTFCSKAKDLVRAECVLTPKRFGEPTAGGRSPA